MLANPGNVTYDPLCKGLDKGEVGWSGEKQHDWSSYATF